MPDDLLERLADLAVGFGANVQPGQVVRVAADIDQRDLARAVADAAYRRGATFVDVAYFDPWVKRARIELAPEETLDFVPPWYGDRVLAHAEGRGATVALAGLTAPGVLDGLDSARAGRDQLPFLREIMVVANERTVNWTVVPAPIAAWACIVYPDLVEAAALARLRGAIERACRLDEPDPIAAWEVRLADLRGAAERLSALELDAVHFEGLGTDVTVGLLPGSHWLAASLTTVDGIQHLPNIPTEEVFTTPDPERTDGYVRSTRPLSLFDGTMIQGLEVRFEGGRAVEIRAEEGAEVLRARAALDDGAAKLGEVALVDRESRVGSLDTVFFDTLLDENAASHIAIGDGLDWAVAAEDRPRINRSAIHIDFMIGGNDVAVTGITRAGDRVPLLLDGAWQT